MRFLVHITMTPATMRTKTTLPTAMPILAPVERPLGVVDEITVAGLKGVVMLTTVVLKRDPARPIARPTGVLSVQPA